MKLSRFWLLAVVILIGGLFVTAADLPEAFITKYNEAVREFRLEAYDKALSILDQAEKVAPNQPDAINLRGAIHLRRRDFPKAQEAFERALVGDPTLYYPKFNLAEILFLQKKYGEAREKFDALLPQIPTNLLRQEAPLVRYKILLTFLQEGNTSAAQEIADRFSPDGETPAYFYAKAALSAHRGQTEDMEKLLGGAKEKFASPLNQRFAVSLQELKMLATTAPTPGPVVIAKTEVNLPTPAAIPKVAAAPAPTADWARLNPEKFNPPQPKPVPPVATVVSPVIETITPVKPEVQSVVNVTPRMQSTEIEVRAAIPVSPAQTEKVMTAAPVPPMSQDLGLLAKFDEKFNEALKQFAARDYAQTQKLLAEADQILPRQAGVPNLRGVIFVKQKEYDAAEAEFDKALDIDSNFWKARLNKGELSFTRKNYAEARRRYQALLESTPESDKDLERDYLKYRIFFTQLLEGQKDTIKETMKSFDYSASTPWQHFSAAASEYFEGRSKEAESWIASATRIYDPTKNQIFAQGLADQGWIPGKADGSEIVAKAEPPSAEIPTPDPQTMPVELAAKTVSPSLEVVTTSQTDTPMPAAVTVTAQPEWKDNPDFVSQIKTWLKWLLVLLIAYVGGKFVIGWIRRSEMFKASIPAIDPLDIALRQPRPALAGAGSLEKASQKEEPKLKTKPNYSINPPPPTVPLTTSAMALGTSNTPPPPKVPPTQTQKIRPPIDSRSETAAIPTPTPTPVSTRPLPVQIPPTPVPAETARKSYAAPNKKFELRTADSTEPSVQTAASIKVPLPAVVQTLAAVTPETPSIPLPGTIPPAVPAPIPVPVPEASFPPLPVPTPEPIPSFVSPLPPAPIPTALDSPEPPILAPQFPSFAEPVMTTPASSTFPFVAPSPVAVTPTPQPFPVFPAQPPQGSPSVPASPAFFERAETMPLPAQPAPVAPPIPATPSPAPAPVFAAPVASVPSSPSPSFAGFTPAGPVTTAPTTPVPLPAPASFSTPYTAQASTMPTLVPTVRHGFGLSRIYLTADFQIAALRMLRVVGENSTVTPTFELISRLPEPPSVPRGYVELLPMRSFDLSVINLASDANAVVHLLPSSESMSISADFVSMQPLAHLPLPSFEMRDVTRNALSGQPTAGQYFQIAAVDLNSHFEVGAVLLYRMFDASMMMALSRPFDITAIQLGHDFTLSAVQLGRSTPGRRSVVAGAGSQSTPTSPGAIEFKVLSLQISSRFEVEGLQLNPGH